MSKVYAYVTNECCVRQRAILPGDEVNGTAIARHGDYWQWRFGKRETLRLVNDGASRHTRVCARLVAKTLGWNTEDEGEE